MTHDERENLAADLSAYLDGELAPADRRRVEHELEASAEARRMLAALREVAQQVRALPREAAPVVLGQRVRDELRRASGRDAGSRRGPAPRVHRMARPLLGAAAIVATGFVAWFAMPRTATPTIDAARFALEPDASHESADVPAAAPLGGIRGRESTARRGGSEPTDHRREPAVAVESERRPAPAVTVARVETSATLALGMPVELLGVSNSELARLDVDARARRLSFDASQPASPASPQPALAAFQVILTPQRQHDFEQTRDLLDRWAAVEPVAVGERIVAYARRDSDAEAAASTPVDKQNSAGEAAAPAAQPEAMSYVVNVPAASAGAWLTDLSRRAQQQLVLTVEYGVPAAKAQRGGGGGVAPSEARRALATAEEADDATGEFKNQNQESNEHRAGERAGKPGEAEGVAAGAERSADDAGRGAIAPNPASRHRPTGGGNGAAADGSARKTAGESLGRIVDGGINVPTSTSVAGGAAGRRGFSLHDVISPIDLGRRAFLLAPSADALRRMSRRIDWLLVPMALLRGQAAAAPAHGPAVQLKVLVVPPGPSPE